MLRLWTTLSTLGWIFWLVRYLFANRGFIPFSPHVRIYEPNQHALIAWNGKEQILILSTNMRASESSQVLEVLPLPSEPTVKEGDLQVFNRAVELMRTKSYYHGARTSSGIGRAAKGAAEPAGEVTFHERIGTHDISVVHVLHRDGFTNWVESHLLSAGVEKPQMPKGMNEIVQQYLDEGFVWFVFDVVSLSQDLKTSNPIQYRFSTPRLFYPLKITQLGEGETLIELFVVTDQRLVEFSGISRWTVRSSPAIELSAREVEWLSTEVAALFEKREALQLQLWEIEGSLHTFRDDLVVDRLNVGSAKKVADGNW